MLASFFFFSSRRRHTRWPRDWSSDVCSSDLASAAGGDLVHGARPPPPGRNRRRLRGRLSGRSEERRVGKECRSRGWRCHEKKKVSGGGADGRRCGEAVGMVGRAAERETGANT